MKKYSVQKYIVVALTMTTVGLLLLFMFVIPVRSATIPTATGASHCPKNQPICGALCTGNMRIDLGDAPQTKFHVLLGQSDVYQHAIHNTTVAQYYQCESAYITIKLFL